MTLWTVERARHRGHRMRLSATILNDVTVIRTSTGPVQITDNSTAGSAILMRAAGSASSPKGPFLAASGPPSPASAGFLRETNSLKR